MDQLPADVEAQAKKRFRIFQLFSYITCIAGYVVFVPILGGIAYAFIHDYLQINDSSYYLQLALALAALIPLLLLLILPGILGKRYAKKIAAAELNHDLVSAQSSILSNSLGLTLALILSLIVIVIVSASYFFSYAILLLWLCTIWLILVWYLEIKVAINNRFIEESDRVKAAVAGTMSIAFYVLFTLGFWVLVVFLNSLSRLVW